MFAFPNESPLRNADFHSLLQEVSAYCQHLGGTALPVDKAKIELLMGRSNVTVLQVSFPMPAEDVLRFVIRVHGVTDLDADAVRQQYLKEFNTLRRLEPTAKKYISREFINREFYLRLGDDRTSLPVVVLRHASDRLGRGTKLESFDALVATIVEADDVDSARTLANVIVKAKPDVDFEWQKMDDYDLPQVESATDLARRVADATLPDFILDLEQCSIRDGFFFLGSHFAILEKTTIAELESAPKYDSTLNLLGLNEGSKPVCVRAKLVVHGRSDDGEMQYVHCKFQTGALGLVLRGRARNTVLEACQGGMINAVTQLVIPPGEIVKCETYMKGRGITADAVIPHSMIKELISSRRYHVTTASHGDLHCGNVLADVNTIKVIDFYNPKFRIVHSDWARLSTSLMAGLEAHLSENRMELPYDNLWPNATMDTEDDSIRPLHRILLALAGRRTDPDEYETLLVYAIEASRFLRYILEGTLKMSRLLVSWCKFWKDHLLATLERLRAKSLAEQEVEALYDLWDRSLRTKVIPGHSFQTRRVLRAVAKTIGPRVSEGLTKLEQNYVEHDRFESRDTAHLLILGPTSSGKSTIAQTELVRHFLAPPDSNRPCSIYIAPTKALAHAAYREIQQLLATAGIITEDGTEVIVSTGDERQHDYALSNGRFKIACVVNEKANAVVSRSPHLLDRVGLLVVDELHMIEEPHRGPVLETLLMKLRSESAKGRSTIRSRWSESIVPRLIGISTEHESGESLPAFFTLNDEVGDKVEPVVVHAPMRPITICHSLVFRDDQNTSEDAFRLSVEKLVDVTGDRRRYLTKRELGKIEDRLGRRVGLATNVSRPDDHRGQRNSMTIDLCKRLLTRWPTGRTILVFTSSIRECGDIARKVAGWRTEHGFSRSDESDSSSIRIRFDEAVDDVESAEEAEDLRTFAKSEVYIHNSEIRNSVRTVIEDLFRTAGAGGPSRVLVATTTLAYGVNLAVTDVILEHTHFPSSTRIPPAETSILDDFNSVEQLEPVEFHNMAGRAGRLGYRHERGEGASDVANFFIISPRGVNPVLDLVVPYYTQRGSSLQSVLFAREDIRPLARRETESIGWLATGLGLEQDASKVSTSLGSKNFSFPFARSVLDIARHLCYANVRGSRTASNPLKPVTKEDVWKFIFHYSFRPNADERQKREAKYLTTAIEIILRDSESLGLLKKEGPEGASSASYTICPIGESMLETGTEFAAVIPLLQLTKVIRQAWADFGNKAGVDVFGPPTEAYILALVFQEDVCRRHRTAIPEWRSSRDDNQWSQAQQDANKAFVLDEVAKSLIRIAPSIKDAADALAITLRQHLNEWLRNELFRDMPLVYEFAAADGGLRFFSSIVRWINGDTTDDCRNVLIRQFDRHGNEQKGQRFFGFADYVSRLSYRARFLAALSLDDAQNERSEMASATLQLERELLCLSERLAHGCIASAVPLFWQRSSDLSRPTVREFLDKGLTATKIVRDDIPKDLIEKEKADQLINDISKYAASHFERLWRELRPREVRAEAVVSVVEAIDRWVQLIRALMNDAPRSAEAHDRGTEILTEFTAASALAVRDQTAERELPSTGNLNDAGDDRPVIMFETIRKIDCGAFYAGNALRLASVGSNKHDRVLALIATPYQSAEGAREACQRVIAELESDETIPRLSAICCIIWPWGNAQEFEGKEMKFATQSHDTVNVFFLTPLGFCALASFIIRALYSPSQLFEIAQTAQGKLVTVSRLIDEFGLLNNRDVPSVLRQDLLAVFEVA